MSVHADEVVRRIAQVAHEANRAYCDSIGDTTASAWVDAPQWQIDSEMDGVVAVLSGKVTSPEESHRNWLEEKTRAGWGYGPVKDPALKQHPCYVPYEQLPANQRMKDTLFFAIVRALAGYTHS